MQLREFFHESSINLDLKATTKDDCLVEMIGLLGIDERASATLFRMLRRRESLGTTGVGRGFAIPHSRSLVANRLRLAYGRSIAGIDYDAIDGKPVHHVFLIVAPPLEVSNQYLPVLGKIAQFAQAPDTADRLMQITSAEQFFALLAEKGV